jgi:hypothetical protein
LLSSPRQQRLLDGLAVSASTLCLIHCLVLPVALVAIPTLAAFLAVPEAFHLWVFLFAVPTSLLAMVAGHGRHGRTRPFAQAVVGLALIGLGALAVPEGWAETGLTVAGSLLLAWAHAANWRLVQHR